MWMYLVGKPGENSLIRRTTVQLQQAREISASAYVLRFERGELDFLPGQHILLGPAESPDMREYSLYSSPEDDYLEVLIRGIPGGSVSTRLRESRPGEMLRMEGPYGSFTLEPEEAHSERFLLIATGTGIAPFRSFLRTYPDLDCMLLHGTRSGDDVFETDFCRRGQYIGCTSRDRSGLFAGRVTDWLIENVPPQDTLCYLCGNPDMVFQSYRMLADAGIPRSALRTEVYF